MDGADAPQPARSGSGVTACSTSTALGRMNGAANANAAAAMEERFADVCKVRVPINLPCLLPPSWTRGSVLCADLFLLSPLRLSPSRFKKQSRRALRHSQILRSRPYLLPFYMLDSIPAFSFFMNDYLGGNFSSFGSPSPRSLGFCALVPLD